MLDIALTAYGYVVVTTTDAHHACELAQSLSFDAIVLDYAMPEMDGAEMAHQIRRVRPNVPIIFFTGSLSRVTRAASESVDAVLEKHEGPRGLTAVLNRLIAAKQTPLRRFPRYQVRLPFILKIQRGEKMAVLHGFSTDLGEGGLGGILEGDLQPGDRVELEISGPVVEAPLHPEAEVRYRQGDSYGFQFLNLSTEQEELLRNSCKQLARA
jgi:CheY-like chemotaxis protein